MQEFKVGDKVKLTGGCWSVPQGSIGRVVGFISSSVVSVKWCKWHGGHDCNLDCGNSGWNVFAHHLTLIRSKRKERK